MALVVRPARADELTAVGELTVRVYRDDGYGGPDYEPALRDATGRAASATVLVAHGGGDLVGAVTVATRGGEWSERSAPGEAVLRMLAVVPEARGAGAGTALVRAATEVAVGDGCSMMRLSSQEAMTAAHRLYERLGFVRTPQDDWSPRDGMVLRTYGLPLAPWCGQCGGELTASGHERCRAAARLDPPRYCAACRRRQVVQVTPTGWTARCVEHGTTGRT